MMTHFAYLPVVLGVVGLLGSAVATPAHGRLYKIEQLQIEDVGEFAGPQVLRIVMLTMELARIFPNMSTPALACVT